MTHFSVLFIKAPDDVFGMYIDCKKHKVIRGVRV